MRSRSWSRQWSKGRRESKQQVLAAPQPLRQECLREFEQFFGAYRKGCADLGVDYKVMITNSNLELA